ncbi:MAG: DNA polymerase III subunit delta [Firmicutes bacterium]|nr:DNA polymerase III subunit delta [Bacillota bacterium]
MYYWQGKKKIESGKLSPAYLFTGEEDFLQDELLSVLAEKFFGEPLGNLTSGESIDKLDGRETSLEAVIDLLLTPSLFRSSRFIVVRHAQYFSDAHAANETKENALLQFLQREDSDSLVVFICEKISRRSRLVKALEQAEALIEFPPLRGEALQGWIKERLRKEGISITADALQDLILAANSDLRTIDSELKKMRLYLGGRRQITSEETAKLLPQRSEANIFKLGDALGERKLDLALKYLKELLRQGEPPILILHMIARHYRLLYRAKHLLQEGMELRTTASALGVPFFVGRKLIEQARRYPLTLLADGLLSIQETDCQVKSGLVEPSLALELLAARLIGAKGGKS